MDRSEYADGELGTSNLVTAGERQQPLLEVSDTLRTRTDPAEIQHVAMRVLAKQLRLSRAESARPRAEEPYRVMLVPRIQPCDALCVWVLPRNFEDVSKGITMDPAHWGEVGG